MKRLKIALCVLAFAFSAQAASNMDDVRIVIDAPNMKVIKVRAVSHTDGSYTELTVLSPDRIGEYWTQGFYLADVYAVNGTSGYPDTAGTVTITDSSGRQLVGSTAGDTLTLSTSASGVAYLSSARSAAQRAIPSKLYTTITDTQSGSATTAIDLYLVLVK